MMSSFERLVDWGREGLFTRDPAVNSRAAFRPDAAQQADSRLAKCGGTGPPDPDTDPAQVCRGQIAGAVAESAGEIDTAGESCRRAAEALCAAASELVALRDEYLAAHRHEAVELAFVIAGAILGRSFSGNTDGLASRIERAVAQLDDAGPLRLQLASEDHEVVATDAAGELSRIVRAAPIEVSADPELEPGEFRLQAGPAEVDGRLDALLARMRQQLTDTVGGRRSR
ncbi:MAG: FliH/SctL family protein [Myxococcota bacterium]